MSPLKTPKKRQWEKSARFPGFRFKFDQIIPFDTNFSCKDDFILTAFIISTLSKLLCLSDELNRWNFHWNGMKFWIFVYYRLQKKTISQPSWKYFLLLCWILFYDSHSSLIVTLHSALSTRDIFLAVNHFVESTLLVFTHLSSFFFHTYTRLSLPTAEVPPIVNKFIRYWYIFFSISRHKFPCCRLQFYHPTDHIVYTDFFIRGDVCGSVVVENILLSLQFQPSYHNATGSIPLMCLIFFKMKLNQFAISHHLLFSCQQQLDKNLWTVIFSLILILFFS